METEPRTHIFFQDPDTSLFTYGPGTYTEDEVNKIVSLLPDEDQIIRVVWVEPSDYPKFDTSDERRDIEHNINLTNEHGNNLN
jgi:hypothetical protein